MYQSSYPDRKIIPTNQTSKELNLRNPEHFVLANGLNLYYIEAGLEDVARIDIVVGAGSKFQEKLLCASSTSSLLKEGTKDLSSNQIAEKLDFHGAYLTSSIGKDKSVITLFSLTKHLSKLLPILSNILCEPLFSENEFNVHIDRNRQEFLINSEKARYIANREFNTLMFGRGTAYGQFLQLDDFDKINTTDIKNYHSTYYQPKNSYIIVSGRPDAESKKLISNLFGNQWQNNKYKIKEPSNIISTPFQGEKLIEKEKFLQSAIRVGQNVINKFDKDYSKLLFTNTILGGYFGSRLMSNLREDKGLTYGVSSFMTNFMHGSYFAITTEVNIDQTAVAMDEIKKELTILQNDKTSEDEINLVKNYIFGNFLKNFDGPFALAEMFRSVHDFGLNFDSYKLNLDKIMNTTSEDVLAIAQKHLDSNNMTSLVVGKFE